MPATASEPYPNVQAGPHAYGPTGSQPGAHIQMRSKHGHSHSADYRGPHAAVGQKPDVQRTRLSEQAISKPLPTKPRDPDSSNGSAYTHMTEAQRFKEMSLQKLEGKHLRPKQTPAVIPTTTATLSRSVTVGVTPSAADARAPGLAQSQLRRKPVRQFDETSFTGTFKWTPGTEPMVIQTPTTEQSSTAGPPPSKSRNRAVGLYRDAPTHHHSGSWPAHRHEGREVLRTSTDAPPPAPADVGSKQPQGYVISSASLGRHHSASATTPVPGSARTTIQAVFPNSDKTPVASTFQFPTSANSNNYDNKRAKHASTPVTRDASPEERRRKNSHHRAGSESTHGLSPSSCSTTGSSHCDTYRSATSQSQNGSHKRSRGYSDATSPPEPFPVVGGKKGSEVSIVKIPGKKEKEKDKDKDKDDVPFLQRVRTRSNSFTKAVSKMIKYPAYYIKERDAKRSSKQPHEFAGSAPVLTTSERPLATAPAHAAPYSHSLASSTSTATSNSTTTSPPSARHHFEGIAQALRGNSDHGHGHGHGHGHQSVQPQPRPPKRLSNKDKHLRDQYRFSPMTRAAHDALEQWEGVGDLPPRNSGIHHAYIHVKSSRTGPPLPPPIPVTTIDSIPRYR